MSDLTDYTHIAPLADNNQLFRRMLYWMAKCGGSVNLADLTNPNYISPAAADDNTLLRRILYWEAQIAGGGGGGGGASAATQAQVNAGTDATTFVAPLTLTNWALPYGFTKIGSSSGIQSNFEPAYSKRITVSAAYGTDTRTGLSPYNAYVPFATITAAVAAWTSGDTVWVTQGTYTDYNIILQSNLYIYFEIGANITVSAGLSANDSLFKDNGVALTNIAILGYGNLSIHSTNAVVFTVFRCTAGTRGVFECQSFTAGTSGSQGEGVMLDGPTVLYVNVRTTATARNNVFYNSTNSPILLVNVGQSISSPNGGFFCNSGTMYIGQCPLNSANLCMYCTASGTAIYHQVGTLTPSSGGIGVHGVCKGTIASISGTDGVYGVDGPSSGTMSVVVGEITGITGADGRGITSRGAGTMYVTVLGANTSTIPVIVSAGTCTVYNGEHFGNNATATAQILNTGNAQRLNLVNTTLRNANASGANINHIDATATIQINAVLMITGATNCITGTATNSVQVLSGYSNKIVNAGIVQIGGAVLVSASYT